jgi:hypothetical protein
MIAMAMQIPVTIVAGTPGWSGTSELSQTHCAEPEPIDDASRRHSGVDPRRCVAPCSSRHDFDICRLRVPFEARATPACFCSALRTGIIVSTRYEPMIMTHARAREPSVEMRMEYDYDGRPAVLLSLRISAFVMACGRRPGRAHDSYVTHHEPACRGTSALFSQTLGPTPVDGASTGRAGMSGIATSFSPDRRRSVSRSFSARAGDFDDVLHYRFVTSIFTQLW